MPPATPSASIFVAGYYGFRNAGDEAILASLLAHLRELRPGLAFTVTSATPAETAAAYDVSSVLWTDIPALAAAVRAADLVIVGGGGIFHDYAPFDPGAFLTPDHSGIGFYTAPLALAALAGVPAMWYAVGAGPLFSAAAQDFTRAAANIASVLTVRDPASRAALTSLGIAEDRVTVTADAAFGFPACAPRPPAAPRLGVALRDWDQGGADWESEVVAALNAFSTNHNGDILFVPMQRLEGAGVDDAAVANRFRSRLAQPERAAVWDGPEDPAALRDAFAGCSVVLAMRLHAAILALRAGVPAVALSYDAKVREAMRLAGREEFVLDVASLQAGELTKKLAAALAAPASPAPPHLEAQARRNAEMALELLDRGAPPLAIGPEVRGLLDRAVAAQIRSNHHLRGETQRLFGEFDFYHRTSEQLSHRLRDAVAQVEHLVRDRTAAAAERQDLEARLSAAETGVSESRAALGEAEAALSGTAARLAASEAQAAQTETALREKTTQLESTETLLAQTERELRDSAARLLAAEAALVEAQKGLEETRAQREVLAANLADAAAQLQDTRAALAASETRQEQTLQQRDEARAEAQHLAAQAARDDEAHRHEIAEHQARETRLEQAAGALRNEREEALRGLFRFSGRWTEDLAVLRSQRAWHAMVALRKAYTLWRRPGLAPLARWTAALPFQGAGPLEEFEPRLPDVWDYLPVHFSPAAEPPAPESAAAATERRYDVIVLPIFDFEFRFQRPQQLAAEFARRGHRVYWISPSRWLPPDAAQPYRLVPLRDNLWEVQLRGTAPDLYGAGADPERAVRTAETLGALYRTEQVAASAVLVQFPYWAETAFDLRRREGARVLYDCMDDWRNWTAEPRISAWNLAEEQRLSDACDVLVTTSREMQEREVAAGRHALLVRNAADFAAFSAPRPSDDPLRDLPRPIIGYYGAIANWFDLELVTAAAAARPGYSFVLIGQVHQVDVRSLAALPNVRFLGEKTYREIPRYLQSFDVCLIPFRVNQLTKAVDPVKLYEYLSQGKPVVATAMGELPPDPDLVTTAGSTEEFLGALDQAVQEGGRPAAAARRTKRIEYARTNTWSARADALETAIREAFPLVSILIVTYNCEEFLGPCLDAIARNTDWPHYEVVLLDNLSTDATPGIAARRAAADPRIRFVAHTANAGFAGGNNLAAAQARGSYLVFLNPDTVVTPGWIHRLVRHCETDARVGALAAVTNFSGNQTKVDFRYTNVFEMERFALERAARHWGERVEVPVAPLYAVMVPRRVWEQVGELDTAFEVGMFEDDDFSLRIRQAGLGVFAADDCFIHHFGNGSFGKIPQGEALRVFEANRLRYEKKWNVAWRPHTMRPGVRPLDAEVRFEPSTFFQGSPSRHAAAGTSATTTGPVLLRLHPSRIVAGVGFNVQPDGQSALVAECDHATPNSVIVFGGQPLPTSFGGPAMLSALVPAELYRHPGKRMVQLVSDFGESPAWEIEVAPESAG